MKTSQRPYWAVCVLLVALLWMGSPVQADVGAPARTLHVGAVVDARTVRIEAKASGPFEYTTYRPSETLFVVDVAGVKSTAPSGARVLKSEVVSSYRVLQYRAGERAIVRLEVLLRAPVQPRVQRQNNSELILVFEGAAPSAAAKVVQPEVQRAFVRGPRATAIDKVDVQRVAEQTEVRVEGNGQLSYQAIRLSQPDRLVLDFGGARPRVPARNISVSLEPVQGVRVGQFRPGMTRVVIDLGRAAPYTVNPQGNHLTVSFASGTSRATPEAPKAIRRQGEKQGTPVPAPPSLAGGVASPAAPVKQEQPAEPAAVPQAAAAFGAAAGTADPPATPPSEREPTPTTAGVSDPPPVVPQGGAKYTGEPISVNLKDVDLKDFFRLIHEISGLNVVVDSNVKGTLTIVLDDVPWDQALDLVLKNNNLDKQLEGNVLRIATRDTLKKDAETQRDLAKAQAEAVDVVTRTRVLSYAKAVTVRDTLKRFLSSRGEILADERSNSLIIRDIPSVFPDVDGLIKQLDKKSQQVEIEARVVSATRDFARDIGTQFAFATSTTSGRSVFGGLVAAGTSPITTGTGLPLPPLVSSGGTSLPLNANLPASAPTSGVSFAHRSPNFALDFIISAAESKGMSKLLSKPKVITQNNEKATVKQGTKIPIQTVVNNTISVQYIDAALVLEVTPQITAEGTVFMEVKVSNDSPDFSHTVGGAPAITTQSAETRVLINDGGTVVIGGVIITTQSTNIKQVPLLGSIPLMGHLFKETSVSTSSRELLFFLTPRIVPG